MYTVRDYSYCCFFAIFPVSVLLLPLVIVVLIIVVAINCFVVIFVIFVFSYQWVLLNVQWTITWIWTPLAQGYSVKFTFIVSERNNCYKLAWVNCLDFRRIDNICVVSIGYIFHECYHTSYNFMLINLNLCAYYFKTLCSCHIFNPNDNFKQMKLRMDSVIKVEIEVSGLY